MRDELLNLIPDDLLNLIWKRVKPSIKYSINKYYFNKFYCVRFAYINNKNFIHNLYLSNYNFYIIKNYTYIKYLIKNDCIIFLEKFLNHTLHNDKKTFILKNSIVFENNKFKNFIDLCYFYTNKYNAIKITIYIESIIKKHNLTYLIKKEHKNNKTNNYKNNKNKLWKA
jgi:hypothetical protein